MTFLHPWALGFGAIAPVIVALYLLKVRRRPVHVSTLMFWQRVLQENQRRALFQKLRQWLSLLLHLLIFALVLLALARPSFDRAVHEGSSTVLILDTRARMQATEAGGESRMAVARRASLAYARQAGPMRQFAILDSGVRLGFSGDEKTLRGSIQSCEATDAGGDLGDSVRLANDLLAARVGEKHIVIFTDRAERLERSSIVPEFVIVGSARENIAITRFATRPVPASPETFEILAEVANFTSRPWSGNLDIALDEKRLDVRPFNLVAGARQAIVFPTVPNSVPASSSGRLVARLDSKDSLASDNVAYALLRREPPRRVLLVTKNDWFLEKLLAADLRIRFELLAPENYQAAMAAQFEVIILDDVPAASAELPKSGNFLYLRRSPFSSGRSDLEHPVVTESAADHPALRGVNLEHVSFGRASAMVIPPEASGWKFETPLRFGDQPLFITGEYGDQRVAALGFGVADSDLPLRVAFPLMIAGTVQWLAGSSTPEALSMRAGETLSAVEGPFTSLTNGFREWHHPDGKSAWVAVNTFDDRESDLRTSGGSGASLERPIDWTFSLRGWPLWPLLALAAALLFAMEWWFFHRRQTE